jgi:hypothetical protein
MLKVNLIDFHCLVFYKDMLENKYILDGSLYWLNNSLTNAVYLAKWKRGRS